MIRKTLAALLVGGSMVAALGATAVPAQAAGVGIYLNPGVPPPGPGHCWIWSHHRHRWVWACSSPQYYPYYDPPGPVFGFSFGGGPYWGDRYRHDRHDHHDGPWPH